MRKYKKCGTTVGMIVLCLFLLSGAISSGITSSDAAMLFEDDFNDGIINPKWTIIEHEWMNITEQSGVLDMSGTATEQYWMKGGTARLDDIPKSFTTESVFRVSGSGTGYAATISIFDKWDVNDVRLGVNTDPSIGGFWLRTAVDGVIADYPLGTADTNYHTYRIEYNGTEAKVYIDGVLKKTVGINLSNIKIALHANARAIDDTVSAQFDDFSVWSVTYESTVSISTDKFGYSPADTMTISIDIVNPTEDSVTFQWFWGVPQYSIWLTVLSAPIPAGYDDTHDFSFTIPNGGSTPFGNVFYVQLLDASDEVLDADVTWWAYSPSVVEAMPAAEVDIAEEIKKTVEKIE